MTVMVALQLLYMSAQNHTDDGIHSYHGYLDTWEIPGLEDHLNIVQTWAEANFGLTKPDFWMSKLLLRNFFERWLRLQSS